MTKEEAIGFCVQNKDEYIKGFDSIDEGYRAYDCLISCLESGHIKPEELHEYGITPPTNRTERER